MKQKENQFNLPQKVKITKKMTILMRFLMKLIEVHIYLFLRKLVYIVLVI